MNRKLVPLARLVPTALLLLMTSAAWAQSAAQPAPAPAHPSREFVTVLVEIIVVSAAVAVSSIPLVRGSVDMNDFYGIKIRKAYESRKNWDAINKYGGKVMIAWSVIICAIFIPLAFRWKHNTEALDLLTVVPLTYVFPLIQIYRYADSLP